MHPDDQMTPLERSQALSKGQSIDRYPIALFWGRLLIRCWDGREVKNGRVEEIWRKYKKKYTRLLV